MKEARYKDFSLRTHRKNWQKNKPNVCEFELTFGCNMHCRHCYTDCYNKPENLKKELNTEEIKLILDKVYKSGIIWLCFSGGDPLTRRDFLDVYSYAKDKGFIVSIFTNGYSFTSEIVECFRQKPPFVIEITLNAVYKDLYEKISQVEYSFSKVMNWINVILKANLPLKIKTQVTKDNLEELPKIKKFVVGLGLRFHPSSFLHARLNKDLLPCSLRIPPSRALNLDGRKYSKDEDCRFRLRALRPSLLAAQQTIESSLFNCTIGGGDGIRIDPYGNLVPCSCIREPKVNLLKQDLESGRQKILNWIRTLQLKNGEKCNNCSIKEACYSCPGKALLEQRSLEEPVDWFCKLAHLTTGIK